MRVSTIHVRALAEAVEAAGKDSAAILAEAAIASDAIAEPYGWVEMDALDRLMVLAVEHTQDPAFGLTWGEQSPMIRYDLMMMMAGAHAPTLRSSLECLLRFQPILAERPELALLERGETATLRFTPLGTTERGRCIRAEVGIAGLVRFFRYLGALADIRRVSFAHARPTYANEYERVFGHGVRFGAPHTDIEFERARLDQPLPRCNAELHDVLVAQAEHVLARVERAHTHSERLRSHLSQAFPRLPEMQQAAHALGMSERSLRRRLREEGMTYSRIAQETQCLVARRLLADHARSIQEVAYEAGFESPTAFHRAFKRWTGTSPAAYRTERELGRE